jgi:ribonuclease R
VKFLIDEKGKPYDVYFKESKEANWLIEEFMLLANKKVSTYVSKLKNKDGSYKPFVYRVHDQPNIDKIKELARFVSNFGYKLNLETPQTTSRSINKMLGDLKGKPEETMITQLTIRSMAKAVYQTDNLGHYGLSFDYYTHFTSPIRRYPDMMVHRLLFRYLNDTEDQGPDKGKLEQYCKHSSDMEKRAAEAERASTRYKMAEYLSERVGEQFDGVITGVTEWGIYVEIKANKCEGMVRLKDMSDDFYYFDEKKYCVIGRRKNKMYRLGDDVEIIVNKVDLPTRQIDFLMVETEGDNEPTQKAVKVARTQKRRN